MIRFYFKNKRWHVTTVPKSPWNAQEWWNAINEVKCRNHKLRLQEQRK